MERSRIQVPETLEHSLTHAIGKVMFLSGIDSVGTKLRDGMRFTDYKSNRIMTDLALGKIFNSRSFAEPVTFEGQRSTLTLNITYERCDPPKDGMDHIYTITPV